MTDLAFIKKWQDASRWSELRSLSVDQRIALHTKMFADWDSDSRGPAPIYFPTESEIASSNLQALMKRTGHTDFESLRNWWQSSPQEFWSEVCHEVFDLFDQRPQCVLEYDDPRKPNWFPKAKLNIADCCLQSLTQANPAIKYAGADGLIHELSDLELRDQVQLLAARIRKVGFEPGDRLAIVMPMNAMSVVIYLGILYAGCAAVSIADSFAAGEIAKRLRISQAKGVFYCDSYQRAGKTISLGKNVNAAQKLCADQGQEVQLFSSDHSWPNVAPLTSAFVGSADHIINILFSSGTTGDPKAIPWDQTTPIKCALDGKYHQDIRSGEVVVWPTNLGWMMGPWLIFATMINGGTTGLYEDAPTNAAFGKFVQDAETTMLGVVPALVRHWKQTSCMESLDWSSIRCISSTGEASNEEDMIYLSALAGFRPVIEYCGGTEIGGGYISSTIIEPNVPAAFSTTAIGSRFVILDDDGQPTDEGELYLVPPTIGLSQKLLNRDHFETYYAEVPKNDLPLRRHGDRMQKLAGGYFRACGRVDDTMNPGGIKVGSAEIETIINRVEGVDESAVIAVPENGNGPDQLVAFVVSNGEANEDQLLKVINSDIRKQLNPLIKISSIRTMDQLPRTASNKIKRRDLRALESGR